MAGMRAPPLAPEEADVRQPASLSDPAAASDDERSLAADSWSVKSEYASTLGDDQRQADAAASLAAVEYSSDKDIDGEESALGFQSYWDAAYTEDLANYQEHGHAGEIWFGADVMDTVVSWTKTLCANLQQDRESTTIDSNQYSEAGVATLDLSGWNVLDIGTGNGILLQALARQGFSDLTGTDYSESAIELATKLAIRDGYPKITFMVDDVLDSKLDRKFKLVLDKGTLDAIGLHPDGLIKKAIYWKSVSDLLELGGLLVITSCNNTKDELLKEVENFNSSSSDGEEHGKPATFKYLDHVRTYPTFMFGGVEGSRVCTVAFIRS